MMLKQKIQNLINEFKELTKRVDVHGNTYRSISEERHIAICNAEQWLANGGLSQYSNQDLDIYFSLVHSH